MQNVELETHFVRITHLCTTRLTKYEVCTYKNQKGRNVCNVRYKELISKYRKHKVLNNFHLITFHTLLISDR